MIRPVLTERDRLVHCLKFRFGDFSSVADRIGHELSILCFHCTDRLAQAPCGADQHPRCVAVSVSKVTVNAFHLAADAPTQLPVECSDARQALETERLLTSVLAGLHRILDD